MRDKIREFDSRDNLNKFIKEEILLQKEIRENIDMELKEINIKNTDIEQILEKGEKPYYKFKEFLKKEIEIPTSLVAGVLIIILTSSLIINITSIKVNAKEIMNSKINVVSLEGDNK